MSKEMQMRTNRMLVLIGGLFLIIGSRLPWISAPVLYGVGGPDVEALEIGWGDSGYITGGIGLILLLVGIFWKGRTGKRYSIPGVILAALPLIMIIGGFSRILEIDPDAGFLSATDVGIYVTLIGALLAFAGGVSRTSVKQVKQSTILLIIVIPSGLMLALYLGLGYVRTASPPLEPITPHAVAADAQPVVIDTDMAADDWLAILYLLGRSDVDVQAITVTGAGEAHCSPGTRNALDLVALAGRPEIPVACGRETPLEGDHAFPIAWRDRYDDLLGLTLPENRVGTSSESAVELLTRIIGGSPQKVHLITLGPLTNVGEALEAEPGLVMNLEMITVMGGAVKVPGSVGASSNIENEVAGWNFYVDPRAAAEVFDSGAPVTLVPLDATNYVPLTLEFISRLERDRTTSVAEFVYRVLAEQAEFLNLREGNVRSGEYYFWDSLAAAIAIEGGLATFQEIPLIVVEEEGPEIGRTLESERGTIIRVAMTADRERFEALFLDAVNGRLP
jgi:pyrimidine-specific ribonucleoside hydrolase